MKQRPSFQKHRIWDELKLKEKEYKKNVMTAPGLPNVDQRRTIKSLMK